MRQVLVFSGHAYILAVMQMKSPLFLLFPVLLGLILWPEAASGGVIEALRLCGTAVIPALFPYMVLCKLIVALGVLPKVASPRADRLLRRLYGVGGEALTPLLLSFIGGYPVGVAAVCEQYRAGRISKAGAQRAICFCNNSGPAFFFGVIGGQLFHDSRVGLLLYLIHVLSGLIAGILTAAPAGPIVSPKPTTQEKSTFGAAFLDAVSDSCNALLKICGLVLTFRVLLRLLEASSLFRLLPTGSDTLLAGLLELTCGILSLQPGRAAFLLSALFMGWGGLCVHMQAASLYRPLELAPQGYYVTKLLHGLLSLLLAWVCCAPTPFRVLLGVLPLLLCAILPQIRKKWTGNPRQVAV